jgi:hypothetical protein
LSEQIIKCCECGVEIKRKRAITKNRYGTWPAKCDKCRIKNSKKNQLENIKKRYKNDSTFRKKILERAKDRYWKRRCPTSELSTEEKALLTTSYPVHGPNCLGTCDSYCNVKKILVNGQWRIKGAVLLEKWKKNKH